jgi:hypothetical protein
MSMNRLVLRRPCVALLCLAALFGGCKKKPTPPPSLVGHPAAARLPTITCPPEDKLVKAVEGDQKGRTVRTACVVFAPGYYWLAAAVSYDPKTSGEVRVHLISGGQAGRISDVEPVPAAALTDLIKASEQVDVQIRKGNDNRLVRMGVRGRHGGDLDEVGMVLQLVAHAPPRLLWVGAGDQRRTADGCTTQRTVDFEMPFGTRLEMMTAMRATGGPQCTSGPTSQQQIESRGVALKAGRDLTL